MRSMFEGDEDQALAFARSVIKDHPEITLVEREKEHLNLACLSLISRLDLSQRDYQVMSCSKD